jgi:acetylxylan esterase
MIVARASTEALGQGIIGAVATQVQQTVPGSDSEAVDYPATLTNYLASEASGVAGMLSLIQSYAARCPKSKIALLGYSQGAQVAGDVMCGTSEAGFNGTQPLSADLAKNGIFPLLFSSPSFLLNR